MTFRWESYLQSSMLPYIKDDLFLCPVRFPCLGRIKKKSQVISHYGVQQTNPLEALIYVTGQKKRLYLPLDSYCRGRWVLCSPRRSLACPVCCVQASKPGGHFLWVWIPVRGSSHRGVSEHLFSKMKAQAETRAVLRAACSSDFF